jgi:hypothetical protein
MNIALWVVQAVLALAFIAAGSMKVFAYEKYKAMSEKNGPMDLKRGLVTFIGLAELAGAIGVVLPMAANVAQPHSCPWTCHCHAAGGPLPPAPSRTAGRSRGDILSRPVCGGWAFFPLGMRRAATGPNVR